MEAVLQPLPFGLSLEAFPGGLVLQGAQVRRLEFPGALGNGRFEGGVHLLQAGHQIAVLPA